MQPYDTILGLDGFEAIYTITQQLGGLTVYIPHARKIFARCLEIEARREFKGCNFTSIAKKYGYTDRHMRRILDS